MNPKTELFWQYVKMQDLRARVIFHGDRPYLARFYLVDERSQGDGTGGLYLHYFFKDDPDRDLHNHPWDYAHTFILAGGYVETFRTAGDTEDRIRTVQEGSSNKLGHDHFHRVELLEPGCWSLFKVGPRSSSWGFLDEATGEVIDFKDYLVGEQSNPEKYLDANDPELDRLVRDSRELWLSEHPRG